jgi:hypothetical protein
VKLAGIRAGDIVECNVKGRQFYAIAVTDGDYASAPIIDAARPHGGGGELQVDPITHGITYRRVTARQVIRHWRRARRPPQTPGAP